MWNWLIEPEDLTPTGNAICGGEIFVTACSSKSRSSSNNVAQLIAQPSGYSGSSSSSAVELWQGTRSGYSGSRSSSRIDIGRDLVVISDYGMVAENVNVVRIGGSVIGVNTTPSRNLDVTVRATPDDSIDGIGLEVVDGGTSDTNDGVLDGGSSSGFSVVTVAGSAYAQVIDVVSDFLMYKGWAVVGSLTSSPVWRIQKVVIGFDDDVTKTWADGDAEFDNVWDDRLSLTYS